jgi:16S rRNA (uracil1498-N3)-methyltransferase
MGAHSFFVDPACLRTKQVSLPGRVAHQIRSVLRLRAGDDIELLDGSGALYEARLAEVTTDGVSADLLVRREPESEPSVRIDLYQALLKGEKMELVLQKGTEIGVTRFIPLLSERCISRPTVADLERKLDRWRAIVREAAEQSGRAILPEVGHLHSLAEACKEATSADLAAMAWEEEHAVGIGAAVREAGLRAEEPRKGDARPRVALLIGPEGGFSSQEAREVRAAGLKVVSLGPRILRAETAALVATTLVLCESGDMGG